MMPDILPSIFTMLIDLLHGRMRIDTKLVVWVLQWLAIDYGKVPIDKLLLFLIRNKYGASARGVMRRLKSPKSYKWEAAVGAPGKVLAAEVQRWVNPREGLLWWLPEHMTVPEERMSFAQQREIAVVLYFYCQYKAWLRILLHDAQRIPPEHAFHETVRQWADGAMVVYHVLVKTGTLWLVRTLCLDLFSAHAGRVRVPAQSRMAYVGRIFMEVAAQLHYNVLHMQGRGAYRCLGEWVECLVKMVAMWNQNGCGDQTGRAFRRLLESLVRDLTRNHNLPRTNIYMFDAAMQTLPTQRLLERGLQRRWQGFGYVNIVNMWRAFLNSGRDRRTGKVTMGPYYVGLLRSMEEEARAAELRGRVPCLVSLCHRGGCTQGAHCSGARGGGGGSQAGRGRRAAAGAGPGRS